MSIVLSANTASSVSAGFAVILISEFPIEVLTAINGSLTCNPQLIRAHSISVSIAENLSMVYQPTLNYGSMFSPQIAESISSGITPGYSQRVFFPAYVGESFSVGNEHEITAGWSITMQVSKQINRDKFNLPNFRIDGDLLLTLNTSSLNKSRTPVCFSYIGGQVLIGPEIIRDISTGIFANLVNNVLDNIDYGDNVYLLVNGHKNNKKVYRGIVKERNPQDRIIEIKASLGDGILSERIIKEDYDEQDIGETAKQIIDDYCAPLTSGNINTNTGIYAPVKAKNKKPLTVFENLRREHGIYYFVSFDWDVHLYTKDEIDDSKFQLDEDRGYKIKLGDD